MNLEEKEETQTLQGKPPNKFFLHEAVAVIPSSQAQDSNLELILSPKAFQYIPSANSFACNQWEYRVETEWVQGALTQEIHFGICEICQGGCWVFAPGVQG